jgi:hypothetical protein
MSLIRAAIQFARSTAAVPVLAGLLLLLGAQAARPDSESQLSRRTATESEHPTADLPARQADLSGAAGIDPAQATEGDCLAPPNPIVAENCLPGTDSWRIVNLSDEIEGYASETSINAGERIEFLVDTDAAEFDLYIFRSGYYGGKGGRLITSSRGLPGKVQPDCTLDPSTGLVSCSNWSVSYSLTTSEDWVSGVYIAKMVRPDTGGENYYPFVIRNDSRGSDILFQLSVNTYQAYNNYGGKCVYSNPSWDRCPTVTDAPRAVQVSFDRPYAYSAFVGQNSYYWSDYTMVSWLEAQGYDVAYNTDLDAHQSGKPGSPNSLLDHRLLLVAGHNEYWSQEMRDAVTAARDHGVHLGFFSSNVSYWRIRMEPDALTGRPDRVITTYKTTEGGPVDPSGLPTGTWRDPSGANNPEVELVGIQYVGDNDNHYFPLRVTAAMANDPMFRHTGLQEMPEGTFVDIGQRLVGWEWDAVAAGRSPAGLVILAESPTYGELLIDAGGKYRFGNSAANVTRYLAPSGAIVFAAGTNNWAWGLSQIEPNPLIQQITVNLLADMGAIPGTPAGHLVLDDSHASPGVTAPTDTELGGQDPFSLSELLRTLAQMSASPVPSLEESSEPGVVGGEYRPLEEWNAPTISEASVVTTERTARITWATNEPASGKVWVTVSSETLDYGAVSGAEWQPPILAAPLSETPTLSHEFTISYLQPDTTYYYRAASRADNGEVAVSDEGVFQTAKDDMFGRIRRLYLGPARRFLQCWWAARSGVEKVLLLGFLSLCLVALIVARLRRWRGGSRQLSLGLPR